MKQVLRWIAFTLLAMVAGPAMIYGGFAWRLARAVPSPGTPLIDQVNAERRCPGVTLAERLKMARALTARDGFDEPRYLRVPPTDPARAAAREWLTSNREALDAIVADVATVCLGYELVPRSEFNGENSPYLPHARGSQSLARIRTFGRILREATILSAAEGDVAATERYLLAQAIFARRATEDARIDEERLVALSILSMTTATIVAVIEEGSIRLTDAGLAAVDAELAAIPKRAFGFDRAWAVAALEDTLARAYSDAGNGNGRITSRGLEWIIVANRAAYGGQHPKFFQPRPFVALGIPRRAVMREFGQDLIADFETECELPLIERIWTDLNDVEPEFQWLLSSIPDARTLVSGALTEGLTLGARLTISAERFRLGEGREPREVAELAAARNAGSPLLDPMDGEPLRSVVRDGRLIVYSVGGDGDDDGGRPGVGRTRNPERNVAMDPAGRVPGDWILLGPADE